MSVDIGTTFRLIPEVIDLNFVLTVAGFGSLGGALVGRYLRHEDPGRLALYWGAISGAIATVLLLVAAVVEVLW